MTSKSSTRDKRSRPGSEMSQAEGSGITNRKRPRSSSLQNSETDSMRADVSDPYPEPADQEQLELEGKREALPPGDCPQHTHTSFATPTDEQETTIGAQLSDSHDESADLAELQQAITALEELVGFIPASDDQHDEEIPDLDLFEELNGLEEAISRHKEALEATPHGHSDKHNHLHDLGCAYLIRFELLGELSDVEAAILSYREAAELTPLEHPQKPARLASLGGSYLSRFEHFGELSDVEAAISSHKEAIDLMPRDDSERPSYLNDLGSCYLKRFERLGVLSDIEEAISRLRQADGLTAHDHIDKSDFLVNLGISLRARFQRLEEPGNIEDAISSHKTAVELTLNDHPDKSRCLGELGTSYLVRFERLGDLSDLENAVSSHKDAVDSLADGHPDKPHHLSDLGSSLVARFQRLADLADLEAAILRHSEAAQLTPRDHPEKPARLSKLGSAFRARFERLGELDDLESAISSHRESVRLTPQDHSDRSDHLTNLGNSLLARFERIGELSDLESAISSHKEAVELAQGHSNKSGVLINLGNSFIIRFRRIGNLSDLEDAISRNKEAVELTPPGHPNRPARLGNLGNCFILRFQRLGELNDLESAISSHREAEDLSPQDHSEKPTHLNSLGHCLRVRFEYLGEMRDLEAAISSHKKSVNLTPQDHPERPGHLNNLGNAFSTRFDRVGELRDLEDAISSQKEAVDCTPHDHPDKTSRLSNLGGFYLTRFEHSRKLGDLQVGDLENAISSNRKAVQLTPPDHPDMPSHLNNLCNSLTARFEHLKDQKDLEDAISMQKKAVNITPDGHPGKLSRLRNLGSFLFARFEHLGEPSDLEEAISVYSCAASTTVGSITSRFRASQAWILCARRKKHRSLLHAYSAAISLLPQLAWIGHSLTHRYRELVQATDVDVVREAAATALDSGQLETAVEWLEQGRSIVWGELFQLRSSYAELSSAHPEHAQRLRELSAALEHASLTREKSLSSLSQQRQSATPHTAESLEQQASTHRALAIERGNLLKKIRGFPGFDRFLLHKEFSRLRPSAHAGPVVILNAAETRCDALIIRADVDHVLHVPLSNFTFKRSAGLQSMLGKLLGKVRDEEPEREGKTATLAGVGWEPLLSILWKNIVKPVLDALDFSTPGDLRRIFWCPTGPFTFLPIHAAGLYGTQHSQPGHKVLDFVISSYTPTLSILALPPDPSVVHNNHLQFLAVRQPPSDGLTPLPGVGLELEHIREVVKNSPYEQITLIESTLGTVEEVLELLKEADWCHFACHGIQDAANPTESGLCLANKHRLNLSDIITLSRPRGGLAFLSACQTAMGDGKLSDEAIHIAAGMLFAGYGGVVGSLWSISDRLAPRVARDVYGQLIQNDTRPDYQKAARALHEAVERLRGSKASFAEWLPFIHVGL